MTTNVAGLATAAVAALMCFGLAAGAEESIRTRLIATPIETELVVEVAGGQVWKGMLVDITESGIRLSAELDEDRRKRMRLPSGARLQMTIAFDDVVTVDGEIEGELLERYIVLQSDEPARMQILLALAAEEGFRAVNAAGTRVVIVEKVASGPLAEYVVLSDARENREKELGDFGQEGFRIMPRTIGSRLGEPSAILERDASEPCTRQYRVLETVKEDTLEDEFFEAVRDGFRPVGLTKPGEHVALLEKPVSCNGLPSTMPEYRLLRDFDAADLTEAAARGDRLVACSDGERMCVFEKGGNLAGNIEYLFTAAARVSTLENDLNEAGSRGYRVHPRSLGVQEAVVREIFAMMEKTNDEQRFAYRIVSTTSRRELQETVASFAREGFRVVATTSETKFKPGSSLYNLVGYSRFGLPRVSAGNVPFAEIDDVFVLMGRQLR